MSNNVKRCDKSMSDTEVYICFICLKNRFHKNWMCDDNASTYRSSFVESDKAAKACIHLCNGYKGMCKHIHKEHFNVLVFKSAKNSTVTNFGECFVNIFPYLHKENWIHASNSYWSNHQPKLVFGSMDKKIVEETIDDMSVVPADISSIRTISRISSNNSLCSNNSDKSSNNSIVVVTPPALQHDSTTSFLLEPTTSSRKMTKKCKNFKLRYPIPSRRYYKYSLKEILRQDAERHTRKYPPPNKDKAIRDKVMKEYGGDWDLYSDELTWDDHYEWKPHYVHAADERLAEEQQAKVAEQQAKVAEQLAKEMEENSQAVKGDEAEVSEELSAYSCNFDFSSQPSHRRATSLQGCGTES